MLYFDGDLTRAAAQQGLQPGEALEGTEQALEATERILTALYMHRRLINRFAAKTTQAPECLTFTRHAT
jgi:hypothetical protein